MFILLSHLLEGSFTYSVHLSLPYTCLSFSLPTIYLPTDECSACLSSGIQKCLYVPLLVGLFGRYASLLLFLLDCFVSFFFSNLTAPLFVYLFVCLFVCPSILLPSILPFFFANASFIHFSLFLPDSHCTIVGFLLFLFVLVHSSF